MRHVAIDSNLLILLVVGEFDPGLIRFHKRLQSFSVDDYEMLLTLLEDAELITTPNALTETANLITSGVREPRRSELLLCLSGLLAKLEEIYIRSDLAVRDPDFSRLGLADAAWLALLKPDVELLTVDLDLYIAASLRGLRATNFNHLRDR